MKKIDLIKKASAEDSIISDKAIQINREDMKLSNDQQKVVGKNINLSLPIKNKDNTIPFNVQLNAERKNVEAEPSITEAYMEKKEVDFNSKDKKQVMDINVETQKYDAKKTEAFKNAEGKKDTEFWDKYVGSQLEGDGQPTKIKNNIPDSNSQLPNNPDRFKGDKIKKMVMASIKDADAMLFHIYAIAAKGNRKLSKEEEQQVVDVNAGKIRLIAQMVQPVRRSLEYSGNSTVKKELRHTGNPVFKEEIGKAGVGVYESDGSKIDEFKNCDDAKANYPEGDIENE